MYHPFMITVLIKVHIEGTELNVLKVIYDKHPSNIIINGKKLKDFL